MSELQIGDQVQTGMLPKTSTIFLSFFLDKEFENKPK